MRIDEGFQQVSHYTDMSLWLLVLRNDSWQPAYPTEHPYNDDPVLPSLMKRILPSE